MPAAPGAGARAGPRACGRVLEFAGTTLPPRDFEKLVKLSELEELLD